MPEYVVTIKISDDRSGRARSKVKDAVLAVIRPLSVADAIAEELYVRDISIAEVV